MTVFILALLCSTVYSIELTLTQVDKDGLQHTAANSNVENIVAEGAKGEEFTPNSMKRKLDAEPCLPTTDSLVVTADLTNHALGVWDAKWKKETLEIDEITGQDTDRVLIKELDVTDSITLPAASINYLHIQNNAVRGTHILDNTITGADIQDGGITEADIADRSIYGYNKLKRKSITSTELGDYAVNFNNIAPDAIRANHIHETEDITVGSISIPTPSLSALGNNAPYHGNGVSWAYLSSSGAYSMGPGFLSTSIFGDTIFSIRSGGSIYSLGYFVASDIRIKESIVPVPDNLALITIRKLNAKYYNYKDKVERGKNRTIGFIAQEVLLHIPEAVKITKRFIPNEMRAVNVTWTKLSNSTAYRMQLNNDHLEPGKYRFYMSNQTKLETGTMKELLTTDGQTFEVDQNFENVFLYGKEVDDFLTLSKDKIWAVAYAALQQVDKNQQILQQNVSTMAKTIAALSARLAILESN